MKRAICENHGMRFRAPTIYFTHANMWQTKYAWAKCQDCKETIHMWSNISHPSWQIWKLQDCSEHAMKIDEENVTFKSYNPNRDYPFHAMIVALVTYQPVQYWAETAGICRICGMECVMQSEYSSYKEDGQDKVRYHGWTVKTYLSRTKLPYEVAS